MTPLKVYFLIGVFIEVLDYIFFGGKEALAEICQDYKFQLSRDPWIIPVAFLVAAMIWPWNLFHLLLGKAPNE